MYLKLKVEADGLRKQLKQAEDTVQNLKDSLKGIDKRRTSTKSLISALNKEEAKLAATRTRLKTATDNLAFAQKNIGKSSATMSAQMGDMSKASGAATSSVLELGRVIQDAPYGMRGMGNNITQLASQMAFATKSAGSFRGALSAMAGAMAGPTGTNTCYICSCFSY